MSTTDDNKKVKNTGKEKTFYLGKLGLNWADEADFVYYDVYDEAEKKELVDALTKIGNNEVPICFGTNEDSDFTGNQLKNSIEWTKIPSAEVRKFLEKHICDYNNSMSSILDSVFDVVDDYDEGDFEAEEDRYLDAQEEAN